MNVGLELFDANGDLIYGKEDRIGVISGNLSYHPSLEMVKRALDSPKDDNGYRYADEDRVIVENRNFKKGATLLPYQYSFGMIYLTNFAPYPSFSKNTKVNALYYDDDYGQVNYAEIPTVEDWNEFGAALGAYGGFDYVEEVSVIMPEVLQSQNGFIEVGYDAPLFVNNAPVHARIPYKSTKLRAGKLLCLIGIDAMVFNPG